jgi:mediator of RNA polymerase II transcription subunit 23
MSPAISASAVLPQQRQMQLHHHHHHPARSSIADLFTLYLGVRALSLLPNL